MNTAAVPAKIWSELSEDERNNRIQRSIELTETVMLKRIAEELVNRENINAIHVPTEQSCRISSEKGSIQIKFCDLSDTKYVIQLLDAPNNTPIGTEIRCENYNALVRNIKNLFRKIN